MRGVTQEAGAASREMSRYWISVLSPIREMPAYIPAPHTTCESTNTHNGAPTNNNGRRQAVTIRIRRRPYLRRSASDASTGAPANRKTFLIRGPLEPPQNKQDVIRNISHRMPVAYFSLSRSLHRLPVRQAVLVSPVLQPYSRQPYRPSAEPEPAAR